MEDPGTRSTSQSTCCIRYSYTTNTEAWRFTRGSKSASVRPSGRFA